MYKPGGTIKQLLDKIADQEYILPAIQREFVWWPEQVCSLFDSLLQGYPFGTFLFWKIAPQKREEFQFYDFMQHYHERDRAYCNLVKDLPAREFLAVLDGQQRMTALNIGLRGSYASKMPGKRWSSDAAFPLTHLYLNLLGKPDPESGSVYHFDFLTPEEAQQSREDQVWFRCDRVMTELQDDITDSFDYLGLSQQNKSEARIVFRQLFRTVHYEQCITYYEETEQSLERVLNIFIRMNSGGTPLSYSDLLLSIAIAQWENLDARAEIRKLVQDLNQEGDGFKFSQDLVLKAGLMLSDIGSVGFKVENFNKKNMAVLEGNWPKIRDALMLSVQLLADFGFNYQNLRAESSILPIAYYVYSRKLNEKYLLRTEHAVDRDNIRRWLIRSLLKSSGIWGSGLDTLLTALRDVLKTKGLSGFPVLEIEQVMSGRGKPLTFTPEEIDELCDLRYNDQRTFALLSLIFPGFDLSLHFHVDHIFPQGRFSKAQLKKQNVNEIFWDDFMDKSNRLANLQLLEGSINNEKRQKMPFDWYSAMKPNLQTRKEYLAGLEIANLPQDLSGFLDFYDERRSALKSRIENALA